MIDLFRLCGVARRAEGETLERALAALPDDGRGHADAVRAVLGDPGRRERYERLHLQCRAIATASDALDRDGARDEHGWRDRLADFAGAEEEAPIGRNVRVGPTGDTDTSSERGSDPVAVAEAVPPENMSWEQYLAWIEAMRRHGYGRDEVGPDEGDCVMTAFGPFRIDDANAGDGMSVRMSDAEGRTVTMHWNGLSTPVEYGGRHYFHVLAP